MQSTTKIGTNRGKPRVWLQGNVLAVAGFTRGDHFSISIKAGQLLISKQVDGKRKVSGKEQVPIIDLASEELLTIGPMGTQLSIVNPQSGLLRLKAITL